MIFLETSAATREFGPIETWDVTQVTSGFEMFSTVSPAERNVAPPAGSYTNPNLPLTCENSGYGWSAGSQWNADLDGWDVSSMTTTAQMFRGQGAFNSDLSSWTMAQVTDTSLSTQRQSNSNAPFYFARLCGDQRTDSSCCNSQCSDRLANTTRI